MTDVELKLQVYKDPRPKEFVDEFHARARDHEPEPIYEVVRVATVVHALITFRAGGYDSDKVPNGPVILAPNHASFMDHFFTGAFIRRRVQFMGKSQPFGSGPLSWIYSHGVIPVRRGHHDEEAFISAFEILGRGGAVVMYCLGGRSRTCELAVVAKSGMGRLAPESGGAVVPVAILGSYRSANRRKLSFPKVSIHFGRPVPIRGHQRDDARAGGAGGRLDLRPNQGPARRARAGRARAAAVQRTRDRRGQRVGRAGARLAPACADRARDRDDAGRDQPVDGLSAARGLGRLVAAGQTDVSGAAPPIAMAVLIASVTAGMWALGRLSARYDRTVERPPPSRQQAPWLRGLSAKRDKDGKKESKCNTPERIVVTTVVVAVALCEVSFFFFAGSSLPSST